MPGRLSKACPLSYEKLQSCSVRSIPDDQLWTKVNHEGDSLWRGLPVEGCTMPPVPPIPSTRCGSLGRVPPMGIRQYSSSSTDFTWMPRCCSRASILSLRSWKPIAGRATKDVSSTKILVLEKGMAYRKVGNFLQHGRCLFLSHLTMTF